MNYDEHFVDRFWMGPVNVRVTALSSPGGPGPEVGAGWLAGLAALGMLAMTRVRRLGGVLRGVLGA